MLDGEHPKSRSSANSNNQRERKQSKPARRNRWPLLVFFITIILSGSMSFAAESVLAATQLIVAVFVLLGLIFIGIVTDMVGTAVTAQELPPLVAMSAKKVKGARQGMWLIKNADRISNITADIAGDVVSIVCGACGAAVAVEIAVLFGGRLLPASILVSSLIAALMASGKAVGKQLALAHSREIVLWAGRVLSPFIPKK